MYFYLYFLIRESKDQFPKPVREIDVCRKTKHETNLMVYPVLYLTLLSLYKLWNLWNWHPRIACTFTYHIFFSIPLSNILYWFFKPEKRAHKNTWQLFSDNSCPFFNALVVFYLIVPMCTVPPCISVHVNVNIVMLFIMIHTFNRH